LGGGNIWFCDGYAHHGLGFRVIFPAIHITPLVPSGASENYIAENMVSMNLASLFSENRRKLMVTSSGQLTPTTFIGIISFSLHS